MTLYTYRATVDRVVDGDTLDLTIDLGFHTFRKERVRLKGVDTPEMLGPDRVAAVAARNFAQDWLHGTSGVPEGMTVQTERDKADKYGRMLVTVYAEGVDVSLNQALLDAGHGVAYDGGAKGAKAPEEAE